MNILFNQVADTILDIKPDKRTEVYNFGIDNAFPSLLNALIGMSVTAKGCVNKGSKAIYGGAFGEAGKVIVNGDNQSLNEVFRIACKQYEAHANAWIHVGYDKNLDISSIKVIPSTDPRIGKADDKDYSGKIAVYGNWHKEKGVRFDVNAIQKYDRYNPDKNIIRSQIMACGNGKVKKKETFESCLSNYKGQILHIKSESTYRYGITKLQPVLQEMLLEANAQTFRSVGAEDGFLNTKIVVLAPFDNDAKRDAFVGQLNNSKGAKKSSGTIAIEASRATEDMSKQIFLDDLTSEYNDSLLSNSEDRAKANICVAQDVPYILIGKSDNSIFGENGSAIKQAQLQLWSDRLEERNQLEEVFNSLADRFNKDIATPLAVVNPYEENIVVDQENTQP